MENKDVLSWIFSALHHRFTTHAIADILIELAEPGKRRCTFETPKGTVSVVDMKDYPSDAFIYIGFKGLNDDWLLIVHENGSDTLHEGLGNPQVLPHQFREYMRSQMIQEIFRLKVQDGGSEEYSEALWRGEITEMTKEESDSKFNEILDRLLKAQKQ